MPHPCPNLQEILALEAKIRADKYDWYPHNSAVQESFPAQWVTVKK